MIMENERTSKKWSLSAKILFVVVLILGGLGGSFVAVRYPHLALPIFIICIAFFVVMFGIDFFKELKKMQQRKTEIIGALLSGTREVTPEEFLFLRKTYRNEYYEFNFPGVYVILNRTKNICYIGQSIETADRASSHFLEEGTAEAYADYKNGDQFGIMIISLRKSGFRTLDDLYAECSYRYDVYKKGQNEKKSNDDFFQFTLLSNKQLRYVLNDLFLKIPRQTVCRRPQ
jgi:GIY-YIG catalytic domain.